MTNVPMPESIIEFRVDRIGRESDVIFAYEVSRLDEGHYKAITTTQAEAYANAKVREALEQAALTIEANAEACNTDTRIMLRANAAAVRALIPSTPARLESEQ